MHAIMVKKTFVLSVFVLIAFFMYGFVDLADARSRSGGRSFSPSRSYSKPQQQQRQTSPTQAARPPAGSSGAFTRGLMGGLVGGAIGSMLFGGMAHGMGTGGLGGSGIGFIEILIFGVIIYFLYKKFFRRPALSATGGYEQTYARSAVDQIGGPSGREEIVDIPAEDPLVEGVRQIWDVDPDFSPDGFKETAQDLFFKIQAGWTKRDTEALKDYAGDQLLDEYARHFAEMKQKGHLNRLENIAVRRVDLLAAGVKDQEMFVTVRFIANLLDYTVDDVSGNTVSGDPQNPVKFEENWTFARMIGAGDWRLEGIE